MTKLKELIPYFSKCSEEIEIAFAESVSSHSFNKGTFISMEGERCNFFPIIKSGIIRVFKIGHSGQEITLYRIHKGESCILTTSCLLAQDEFPATAVVEEDSEVLLIPAGIFKDWVRKFDIWAGYIYNYHSKVLVNTLQIIENLTFKKLDIRIIEYLIEQSSKHGKQLQLTHQKIAYDIGTAREVVSRTLKELELQNCLSQIRGKITLNNISELKKRITYLQ